MDSTFPIKTVAHSIRIPRQRPVDTKLPIRRLGTGLAIRPALPPAANPFWLAFLVVATTLSSGPAVAFWQLIAPAVEFVPVVAFRALELKRRRPA